MKGICKIAGLAGMLAISILNTTSPQISIAAPMSMVSGDEALQRVRKLTMEIPWYTSLSKAQAIAQKENKPIFMLHMLGPLNGMT
ncbi:MAG: hypothetical protein K2X77_22545 [Candidatus Obscuribacterales bacterium]|jgi:hypothetical protein|nr:hypothetical protein [Candidatus Obscuribacterales bacterium]